MGDLIAWLFLGALAGGIASRLVPGRTPGGILGGWLMSLVAGRGPVTFLGSLVVAVIGAAVILYGLRAGSGGRA